MLLQGFWTVALYFGLLGIIWLPRYYIVPTRLRLWPSFWLYNFFSAQELPPSLRSYPPLQLGSERLTLPARNISLNIGHGARCFTCDLSLRPRSCSSLLYAEMIFTAPHPADQYEVAGYESYPCYSRLSRRTPQCPGGGALDAATSLFSGCTLCSVCQKPDLVNTSTTHRSYAYTPRFSISTPHDNTILHCLNRLVMLKLEAAEAAGGEKGFCNALAEHVSVYQEGRTLLVTGCSTFCTDSANLLYKELYSSELGVYLIVFATVVLLIAGVLAAIRFILTLYRELGILNVQWNSSQTCPICMDKLYRFTRLSTLRCGHTFCRSCLEQWLHVFNHVTCPLCRQPVDPAAAAAVAAAAGAAAGEAGGEGMLMVAEQFNPIVPGGMDELDQDDLQSVTSDISMASSVQYVTQSIYNIGRNVVTGWHSARLAHAPPTEEEEDETSEVTLDRLGAMDTPSPSSFVDRVVVQDDLSRPIPMGYYPLFPETTVNSPTSLSIVASYGSSPDHRHLCTSPHTLGVEFETGALSDTELSLQNRIARKINRHRQRRLIRRSMSNPEITTSESELEPSFSR